MRLARNQMQKHPEWDVVILKRKGKNADEVSFWAKKTGACGISCDLGNSIRLFLEPPVMCSVNEPEKVRNPW